MKKTSAVIKTQLIIKIRNWVKTLDPNAISIYLVSTLHAKYLYSAFSGLHFSAFGPNTEIYKINLHIQCKYGKNGDQKNSKYGFLRSAGWCICFQENCFILMFNIHIKLFHNNKYC